MTTHANFDGQLVMLGFGSIGQGVLPLILRHIGMPRERIRIVTSDTRGAAIAAACGVRHEVQALSRENYRAVLAPMLGRGDFLLNLSVDVSSVALAQFCRELRALYLDTCVEPWAGGYTDPSLSASQRSNYALRESALELAASGAGQPTAVMTHGANPGLVSHFVKQALLNIAADTGVTTIVPSTQVGWAALAETLGITQYNASKHLRVLFEAGLLDREKNGQHRLYALASDFSSHLEENNNVLDLGCCQFDFSKLPK